MKLKTKKVEKTTPILGEVKIINKFAFLPTKLSNGDIIWLEKYKVKYLYKKTCKKFIFPELESNRGPLLVSQGASSFPTGYYKNEWCEESKEPLPSLPFYKQLIA